VAGAADPLDDPVSFYVTTFAQAGTPTRKFQSAPPHDQNTAYYVTNVQLLRAVAAYMVIFVHIEALLTPLAINGPWLAAAAAGVDIFFVISGFIMVHTTRERRPTP